MRVASEMDFEVQPSDSLDFIEESVRDSLNKIRTIADDKTLTIKVYLDVEFG